MDTTKRNSNINIFCALLSEACFIIFPFIVYSIISVVQNNFNHLLHSPEFAMAASIFFGQSIVHFFSGATNSSFKVFPPRAVLIFVFILLLGFVPSLIAIVVLLMKPGNKIMMVFQIFYFVISIIIFFWLSSIGMALKTDIKNSSCD